MLLKLHVSLLSLNRIDRYAQEICAQESPIDPTNLGAQWVHHAKSISINTSLLSGNPIFHDKALREGKK